MATENSEEKRNNIIGSICVASAMLCFNSNEVIVKWSKQNVLELLYGRYFVQFIIASIWWNLRKPKGKYVNNWYGDDPYIKNIFLRGTFQNIAILSLFYAVKLLPVGDYGAILNQNVLITAFFGRIILKEPLPKLFPLIIIFVVIGSLLMSQPSFLFYLFHHDVKSLNIYGLTGVFIAILSISFCNILVRTAKESHFLQLELVSAAQMIFIIAPTILLLNNYFIGIQLIGTFDTIKFDLFSLLIIIIIGIIGFIGLCLLVIGYQLGDTTKVSWLEYMTIIYASVYQTFLFKDPFNFYEAVGIVFIIIGCLINLSEQYYNYIKAKQSEQQSVLSDIRQHENEDLL